ncbi:MAG: hypothetical protein KIS78_11245 [Labilithrix sp.]|nr:hypothetical protein [Labilithrix sp.]
MTWSSNRYTTSSPTTIAVPATGAAELSITTSSTAISLEVGGLSLGASTALSSTPSWDLRMPTLDGASVQVGSWLPSAGSYLSFSKKKITSTCVQALSTGRVYSANGNGRYTEIAASIYGRYDAPVPPASPPTPANTVFDPSWCSGSPITKSEALAKFQPAATTATLGTVQLDGRKRDCHDQTGCQAWQPTTSLPFYKVTRSSKLLHDERGAPAHDAVDGEGDALRHLERDRHRPRARGLPDACSATRRRSRARRRGTSACRRSTARRCRSGAGSRRPAATCPSPRRT